MQKKTPKTHTPRSAKSNAISCLLYGGSFDPVHNGHLAVLRAARKAFPAAHIVVSCAYQNPFKNGVHASAEDRLAMLRLALERAHIPNVSIDDADVQEKKISYTIDTVRRLRKSRGMDLPKKLPEKLGLVAGCDLADELPSWKDANALARLVHLVLYPRAGYPMTAARKSRLQRSGFSFTLLDAPLADVSSTRLRAHFSRTAAAAARMMPRAAAAYAKRAGLYAGFYAGLYAGKLNAAALEHDARAQSACELFMQKHRVLVQLLYAHVSPARAAHSLRVANLCAAYARALKVAGGDAGGALVEPAFLAGLAHDICREWSEAELLKAARAQGISIGAFELKHPVVLHGQVAPQFLRRYYPVPQESYDAMCAHTLGCAHPSLLQKILFLCDALDPQRALWKNRGRRRAEIMRGKTIDAQLRALGDLLRETFGALHPLTEKMLATL